MSFRVNVVNALQALLKPISLERIVSPLVDRTIAILLTGIDSVAGVQSLVGQLVEVSFNEFDTAQNAQLHDRGDAPSLPLYFDIFTARTFPSEPLVSYCLSSCATLLAVSAC